MSSLATFSISSPLCLTGALTIAGVATALIAVRRIRLPRVTAVLAAMGLLLLSLAAGGLIWLGARAQEVQVMVDVSPSTRGAHYRDRDILTKRIGQLAGRAPYRITYFSGQERPKPATGPALLDTPGRRTVYEPPAVGPVLLFSDCRFELPPAATPTYIVVDPNLVRPDDAAIEALELRDGRVAIHVRNQMRRDCELVMSAVKGYATTQASPGSYVYTAEVADGASEVTARLAIKDPWPENNALSLPVPPALHAERWWVGAAPAPASWRSIDPKSLPTAASAYMAPSVIVLDNVPAGDLAAAEQHRLQQYVRDLGGALCILGGDRAFAAGGYPGTMLEVLSPLSSSPPAPTTHWLLLIDGSGSMAELDEGVARWELERRAILRVLPLLPPEDPVSIGSFATGLTWWSAGKSARQTLQANLPPLNVLPQGPTNLEPALEALIAAADSAMPKELLLMTDAQTQISDVNKLAAGLKQKQIRLSALAMSRGEAVETLKALCRETSGQFMEQLDPKAWTKAIDQLARQAGPTRLERGPMLVTFAGPLAATPARQTDVYNRTWLKKSAEMLATAGKEPESMPMAARWNIGEGTVVAAALPLDAQGAGPLVDLVARSPRDPRFKVTWSAGPQLRISIDTAGPQGFLDGEKLELELRPANTAGQMVRVAIPQSAPGQYELSLPAPAAAMFAAIRRAGAILDRFAIAGRYAPEFDGIGNDEAAMAQLAARTGGAVIEPGSVRPIDFKWPQYEIPLASWLAAAGALCIAGALLWWRYS